MQTLIPSLQSLSQRDQSLSLQIRWCAVDFGGLNEVIVISDRKLRRRIQIRMGFGGGLRRVTFDKAPELIFIFRSRNRCQIEQHRERHDHFTDRHIATMNMPNWVVQPGLIVLRLIGAQLLVILIHRLGNHIKMHPLSSFRF